MKTVKSCKKCGKPLNENALFCGNCGERVDLEKEKDGYFNKLFSYNSLEKEEKRENKKEKLNYNCCFYCCNCLDYISRKEL